MILSMVVAAERPFKLEEMDVILAMQDSTSSFESLPRMGKEKTEKKIRNLCGLFLRIQDSDVHLLHQTAKEFLVKQSHEGSPLSGEVWRHSLQPEVSNNILANMCLQFLLFEDFRKCCFGEVDCKRVHVAVPEDKVFRRRWERYIFSEYALTHWASHVRALPDFDPATIRRVRSILNPQSRECGPLSYLIHEFPRYSNQSVITFVLNERLFKMIPILHADINERQATNRTVLMETAASGDIEKAEVLLHSGAVIDLEDDYKMRAVSWAIRHRKEEAALLLLRHGSLPTLGYRKRARQLLQESGITATPGLCTVASCARFGQAHGDSQSP